MTALTEAAVLDALRHVQEPELGRDIVTLDMVKADRHRRARRRLHHRADDAGLPAQGRDRDEHPGGDGRHRRRQGRHHLGRDGPPRRSPARPSSSCPGSRTSSPSPPARAASARARSASTWPSRWPRPAPAVGLLDGDITGPNIPHDARRRGPAQGQREQQDRAARAPRGQDDLDPVLRPGGPAHRVARPARRRRHPAVPARRRVGRARLPRHRPAAGHVRRPADPRPGRADQRRGARHDPAGGQPQRRGQGAGDVPAA